ncbi:MAG: hypothetical protein HQK51_09255 [Oligoflexia bacterium]|nr:hypothetical protein [Oligoflexia bacterium]
MVIFKLLKNSPVTSAFAQWISNQEQTIQEQTMFKKRKKDHHPIILDDTMIDYNMFSEKFVLICSNMKRIRSGDKYYF